MLASLLKLGTVFVEKQKPIQVHEEKCTLSRHKASSCQACKEVCPTNAIDLTNGPHIDWSCIHCGLCTSVCPTEALELKNQPFQAYYTSMKKKAEQHQALCFHCPAFAELQNDSSAFQVQCLGQLDDTAIQLAIAYEVKEFYFFTKPCKSCEVTQGKFLFDQRFAQWKKRWPELSWEKTEQIDTFKWKEPSDEETTDPHLLDRREFFLQIGKQTKETVITSVIKEKEKSPWENGELNRQKSIRLQVQQKWIQPKVKQSDPMMQKRLTFDQSCTFCGVCEKVCPTAAIKIDKENHQQVWYQEKCIDCQLCLDVCFREAIKRSE